VVPDVSYRLDSRRCLRAARLARRALGVDSDGADANGPDLLSLIVEQTPTLTLFQSGSFYPYSTATPSAAPTPTPVRHRTLAPELAARHELPERSGA
jgi:hypothetical protein